MRLALEADARILAALLLVDSTRRHPVERLACAHRPCGLWDKALVYGAKDCRFESCQGHFGSLVPPPPATSKRASFRKLACVISHRRNCPALLAAVFSQASTRLALETESRTPCCAPVRSLDSTRHHPEVRLACTNRSCGLRAKALVFGTKDCRFESCQGHFGSLFAPSPSKLALLREIGVRDSSSQNLSTLAPSASFAELN